MRKKYPLSPFGDSSLDDDKFREECGLFGLSGHEDASALAALGLHALQHRGQEAGGIASFDGEGFHVERRLGRIGDNFTDPAILARLKGERAIGHTRYSTSGDGDLRNVQPFFAEFAGGGFAVAHNGNLTNALALRDELQKKGSIFHTTSDTETILHLIALSREPRFEGRLIEALSRLEGAFSLVGMTNKKLIGVRDPMGVRPLVLGEFDGSVILASETCALDVIGAKFVRDVEPGELIVVTKDGIRSHSPFEARESRFCIFEYVYFSRPDSVVEGRDVYALRKRIGEQLAKEEPVEADLVVPVPDSGTPSAMGFAEASGLPFELGIIRNHYVGRTFIQPGDAIRHIGVKLKHNANRGTLEGKRVALVDDSIVRGTTSRKIVEMVRAAGADEVHMRIASPPTISSCFYGVDTPRTDKLLAHSMDVEEMRSFLGVDSLGFVSLNGLHRAVDGEDHDESRPRYCDACFSGAYPTPLTDSAKLSEARNGAKAKGLRR